MPPVQVPPVAASAAPASTTTIGEPSSDERWAAWQAKGAAHDRAVRRKMAIAAPILLVVATLIMYALLGR